MKNIIIKKWIEPYILLETLKKSFALEDITFDGSSKDFSKSMMLKKIQKSDGKAFGLYMKNVNKFYVFGSEKEISPDDLLNCIGINSGDIDFLSDADSVIGCVDLAKAEAAILL